MVSFLTGWLAGILESAASQPHALIDLHHWLPTHVAVGTDLFEVMISGLYRRSHLHL